MHRTGKEHRPERARQIIRGAPAAFRRADAPRGASVRAARARTYLDEYEHIAVAGDEIDFAEAATPVTHQDFQPAGTKKFRRERFRLLSALVQWRAAIGTGWPSANCAGVSREEVLIPGRSAPRHNVERLMR